MNTIAADELASETLVILVYNDDVVANLLATPTELHELILGHLVCEGYFPTHIEVKDCTFEAVEKSGSFYAKLSSQIKISREGDSERLVTSSCGACNNEGLELLISDLPIVTKDNSKVNFSILNNCFKIMRERQTGFRLTGGMHAAGLVDSNGNLLFVSEDIGRHNAVDKVVGKALINYTDLSNSTLILSGRCGWDIVAKASRSGIVNIASIGACSSLAAKAARYTGIRIISFLKDDNAVIIGIN